MVPTWVMSRSPSVIALYWLATGRVPDFETGIALLRNVRPCVAPNHIVREEALVAAWRMQAEFREIRA